MKKGVIVNGANIDCCCSDRKEKAEICQGETGTTSVFASIWCHVHQRGRVWVSGVVRRMYYLSVGCTRDYGLLNTIVQGERACQNCALLNLGLVTTSNFFDIHA